MRLRVCPLFESALLAHFKSCLDAIIWYAATPHMQVV